MNPPIPARQTIEYGLAVLAAIAAAVATFLLIYLSPILLPTTTNQRLINAALWGILAGLPITSIATLYLTAKYFIPAMTPPGNYSSQQAKHLPYGIKDILSLIAIFAALAAICYWREVPPAMVEENKYFFLLFIVWGWVIIRSIRYFALKPA